MSITDELREWAKEHLSRSSILAIADRIDAEHERLMEERADRYSELRAKMNNCYVELPKDADGEYIHVGDVLDGYGKTIEVVELRYGRSGWVLISRDGNGYADTFAFTHHEPTVEDVLHDFICDVEEDVRDEREIIAEYAAKLRLAKEDA